MSQIWTGSFKSTTYNSIYGNLKTELKPLTEWNYNTNVYINFTGFISIIQAFFKKNMVANVVVKNNKELYTTFGGANVRFIVPQTIKPDDDLIKGQYFVERGNYKSTGNFYLMKGDGNFGCENNCSIM